MREASTRGEVEEQARSFEPSVVLLDMNFTATTTGDDGLELLQKLRVLHPAVPVILITAWATIELAVEGMRLGAFDFVAKPWENRHLLEQVRTAIALGGSTPTHGENAPREGACLRGAETKKYGEGAGNPAGIVGNSPALRSVLDTVRRVAPTNAPVLILGESGTGKEKIAQAVHELSPRAGKPFVKVNLGGIAQSLFESEMFGHRKGAFTDACRDRVGRFALAEGGTIFLDEIGELDLASQVKLLRVLQDRQYEVLGDSAPRYADVRVVCATNANLAEMVAARTFREDLFYRINLITLLLSPLRVRLEDVDLLAAFFAEAFCRENGRPPVGLSQGALAELRMYPFPGNVRELKNVVERAVLLQDEGDIEAHSIRLSLESGAPTPTPVAGVLEGASTLEAMEERMVRLALARHAGNVSQAAEDLGISRGALYRRMGKFGLD